MNPLSWLAGSFCLGILADNFLGISISVTFTASILFALASLAFRRHSTATWFALASFTFLGMLCHSLESSSVSDDRIKTVYDNGQVHFGDPVTIEGTVVGYPETSPDGESVILEVSTASYLNEVRTVSGNVRIFIPTKGEEAAADASRLQLVHGARIRVSGRLEREKEFQNPGVAKRTDLLDRRGIDATASLKSPLLVERLGRDPVFIPLSFVYKLRANLVEQFRIRFEPRTAGVLIASTFGNKHFLDKETADVFREGGTFHVLVISGLHITFIGGLFLLIVRLFTRNRRLHASVVISGLWLYGIAVGGEPPVIRACVMSTILLIGYASYQNASLLNSFGACAIALLAWKPSDLFDPSFQLTVASVAGIICLGLPLLTKLKGIGEWMPTAQEPFPPNVPRWLLRFCETIYWRDAAWQIETERQIWSGQIVKRPFYRRIDEFGMRRVLIFLFDGLMISLAVQLVLLPFAVVYFHRISPASIALNLWVGPLLAVESIVSFLAVMIGFVSDVAATPFVTLTEILNWMLVSAPAVLTDSGLASFRVPIYSGWMHLIYCVYFGPVIALAVLVIRWNPFDLKSLSTSSRRGVILGAISVTIFASTIVFHPFSSPRPDGRLHVEFLDVGQGDAALITFPQGKTMLVDGGGRVSYNDEGEEFQPDIPRIGEMVVSEFLWERGISRLDYVVATHAHSDHIQGLSDVAKNFSVGEAIFGTLDGNDPDQVELLDVLSRHAVPQKTVAAGDSFEIDGVRIQTIFPLKGSDLSANNNSVVLRLSYGDVSFLLTGDIEREAEDLILSYGENIQSTIVKVPHHGSRTSSTQAFVDAVNAKYAVVSVGRHSIFGHPHPDIVRRWNAGAVMTTGENGTIKFSTDGSHLEISTFLSEIAKKEPTIATAP